MHTIKYIILFFSISLSAQAPITSVLLSKTKLNIDALVHIDNFESQYSIKNNALVVKKKSKTLNYSNLQLGNITSVNAFNPLKLNIFYKEFSTVVILDNRLAEITKINFNTLQPSRDVTHISTGNDNSIWVFNQNTQQLELFDYKTNKTRATSSPITGDVISLYSDYNYCWLMTNSFIYRYNYFGSLVSKFPNNGFTAIKEYNGTLYLLKQNRLYFKEKSSDITEAIKLPELLIKQFLVTNETVYIYDNQFLYHYQLITN